MMDQSVHNTRMPRPVQFDIPPAREGAMMLFWRKGYQAASLPELLAAMSIGRSSFYAAFGDKRSLFVDCLDLFALRTHKILDRARAFHPPIGALRHFFARTFLRAHETHATWGCMLVNTVIELAGVDDELSEQASRHLSGVQVVLQRCLADAGFGQRRAGELAAFLMVVNEGMRVSSRRGLPRRQQLERIDLAFGFLESASA